MLLLFQLTDEQFVSSLEFDEEENTLDLKSLDELIDYLEEHERQWDQVGSSSVESTSEATSGPSSLVSEEGEGEGEDPRTPTLIMSLPTTTLTYREPSVLLPSPIAPSNCSSSISSSPSSSSEYSLESLESLDSLQSTTSELCNLTLTTTTSEGGCGEQAEPKELYEAAETIQKAFRSYHRQKRRGQQLQAAAITIQHCYRRYRQTGYITGVQDGTSQLLAKSRKSLQVDEQHHSEAKRFKTSSLSASFMTDCEEEGVDEEEVDEGMFSCTTGTASNSSADVSMTNSTVQSDEDDEEEEDCRPSRKDAAFAGECIFSADGEKSRRSSSGLVSRTLILP